MTVLWERALVRSRQLSHLEQKRTTHVQVDA